MEGEVKISYLRLFGLWIRDNWNMNSSAAEMMKLVSKFNATEGLEGLGEKRCLK